MGRGEKGGGRKGWGEISCFKMHTHTPGTGVRLAPPEGDVLQ